MVTDDFRLLFRVDNDGINNAAQTLCIESYLF